MTRVRHLPTCLLALAAAGCIEDLDPRSIVVTPRILAIVSDRPEAAPGEDIRIDALVVDPEERPLVLAWSVCSRIEQLVRGEGAAQYGTQSTREGCVEGEPGVFPLETEGDTAIIRGVLTEMLFEDLETIAATFGENLDPETLRYIVDTSGLPITVGLTVYADGEELVRGFKRVFLTTREPRGTNPPPPRFRIGETWVSGRGVAEPFVCVPEEGEVPSVAAHRNVVLSPDEGDEEWQETYLIIDPTGTVIERDEGSFYSWFSTGGAFTEEVTRAPLREEVWKAPKVTGPTPLWLVVRDGHAGTSACRTEVEVVSPQS